MKFCFLFVFLCSWNYSNSQGSAVYSARFGGNNYDSSVLLFDSQKSLFILLNKAINKRQMDRQLAADDGGTTISLSYTGTDSLGLRYLIDSRNKKLTSREFIFENGKQFPVTVSEDIPLINWLIKQEYKMIGNLKCQKAEARFRGRNYTAWFAESIPVSIGPWKFNGLPGLILHVVDSKNEVEFLLNRINFPSRIPANSLSMKQEEKKMTLEEYVLQTRETSKRAIQYIKSKMPKGAVFEVTHVSQNSVETEYEFDKKSSNN